MAPIVDLVDDAWKACLWALGDPPPISVRDAVDELRKLVDQPDNDDLDEYEQIRDAAVRASEILRAIEPSAVTEDKQVVLQAARLIFEVVAAEMNVRLVGIDPNTFAVFRH
jgi:hypothetical protein